MPRKMKPYPASCHYFGDEAGDSTIFGRRGKVLVQTAGCSRFFILGFLHVNDPVSLDKELAALRQELVTDTYLQGIPSMQPTARKTALTFHATDDAPEVRWEVFKVLLRHELRFYAVVRDKLSVYSEVQNSGIRYSPHDLYDKMVSRLFKQHLHQADEYHVTFARRGSSDRTNALQLALERGRQRATADWRVSSSALLHINADYSYNHSSLQAVDYMLWALQRLYEKREDRYIRYVWSMCHLIHDVDDQRQKKYGIYYNQKHPVELGTLKPL